jgi:hypothetical protein
MGSEGNPLEYASPRSSQKRRRGWLSTSIYISIISVIISFGWEDIRFAFPDASWRGNPDLHLDVRINMWIWPQPTVFGASDLLWDSWLLILPAIATALIMVDRTSEHRWNRRVTEQPANNGIISHQPRWLVVSSELAAMLAWVAPFLAAVFFYLLICFSVLW